VAVWFIQLQPAQNLGPGAVHCGQIIVIFSR
jgi:hypothetical protein